MRRRVVAAWTVVLFCLASGASAQAPAAVAPKPVAAAPESEAGAREAFERGRASYDAGQFTQAAAAFEEAYRLSGRDALLYNLYLAHRDANDQAKAAEALRGYLARVPNIENRAQLEARLVALDQGIARDRVEAQRPATKPQPARTSTSSERASDARPASRSTRFYVGIGLASVGGALLVSSLATGLLTNKRASKLEDECVDKLCAPELAATQESGERLARTTDALLFGGLALAGAGAVLLVLDARKPRERQASARPRLSATCLHDGCTAFATGRF